MSNLLFMDLSTCLLSMSPTRLTLEKRNVITHVSIAERLNERGPRNRFRRNPGSGHAGQQATDTLVAAGFRVVRVECNCRPPEQFAASIAGELVKLPVRGEVLS
ncbi:MAG: hypothetical protein WBA97_07920 [Actinophytocola sp.]|uniref:hypothetical protein n=1 Tax=Actinophytocola sp. TaxID=1872138 RepID=UPI003C771919